VRRRDLLAGIAAALPLAAARADDQWHDVDVTGTSPALELTMQATPDGRTVTQADYRGIVTMLYFGYTFCPDVCPLTLQNVTSALAKVPDAAKNVRFLFVTVDPGRDTLKVLGSYVSLFGPEFVGLRGDADQLERLARRFRIAWSVSPSDDPAKYQVTHSSAIYVFDRQGDARLLVPSMASQTPDIDGLAADLTRLTTEPPSWWSWLRGMV
jgi:protein SCO1/2